MQDSMNIQDEKLELVRLLIEEDDISILKKVREILSHDVSPGWEMSEAQLTEVKERIRLRQEGKIKTSPWDEVEARVRNRENR